MNACWKAGDSTAFRATSFAWLMSTGLLTAEWGTSASAIWKPNSSRTGSLLAIEVASASTVARLRTVEASAHIPPATATHSSPATRRKTGDGRRVITLVFRHAPSRSEASAGAKKRPRGGRRAGQGGPRPAPEGPSIMPRLQDALLVRSGDFARR